MFTDEDLDEMTWYYGAAWEDINSTLENDNLIPADWMEN